MILIYTFGFIVGFFALYQFLLVLLSLLAFIGASSKSSQVKKVETRFAILIPAHNEELLIGGLLESIFNVDYPRDLYQVFVIADNCSDNTAKISREVGAQCLERMDEVKRGKPYALEWALTQIDLDQFDAFNIIDADTTIDTAYLRGMAKALSNGAQAIQGYFGVMNPDENWLTRLSILPGILRYKLQCPGKELIGLSCPLAGNGMCFSAEVIKKFGWNAFSIAENWEYYAILTLEGYVVVHEGDAVIYSQVANTLKEGKTQRTRWLKGRIDTVRRYWKRLLSKTLKSGSVRYLDVLIELIRPSHSMLFLWTFVFFVVCAIGWLFFSFSNELVIASAVILLILVSIFLLGLIVQRAPLKTWFSLGMVPFYLIWKLLVSIKGLLSIGDKSWVRTKRH
jgi:cellulose synthase/poly-beta-1,6-N-acetylglucosamine synthase-like glycosyltransferase